MKVFDTFTYFNEDLILDIRLNQLNEFVDKFVIVESIFTHSGERKKLNFDIKSFKKFSDKIIYVVLDDKPNNYLSISSDESKESITRKKIVNALILENYQRNGIQKGIVEADENDLILISDVDEIPKLHSINFNFIGNNLIFFIQYFFHYKLNLYLKGLEHFGTKGCLKKNLISPQWIRNIKNKKYSSLRFDTIFSKKKYRNIQIINDGGWHFSNILSAEQIVYKMKSYLHHADFPEKLLSHNLFEELIRERKIMYDHAADKGADKYSIKKDLDLLDEKFLPSYLKINKEKFTKWMV
tara:strand:+ start:6988 stop:7878 length:891 start_codon:yes stop_codon:yes gene_type:complete